jgi:beta-glucanase (GH16 family)
MFYPVFSISLLVFTLSPPAVSLETKPRHLARKHLGVEKADGHPSFCSGLGWKEEWADEFSEDSLGSFWSTVTTESSDSGDHSAPVSGLGVTACRTARCRPENVHLQDGKLILRSERDPGDASKYFTGAVTTRGLKNWTDDSPYRLCISAKLPGGGGRGKGVWPAHWMLPDNGLSEKCLDEGEVDIMEMINGDGGAYSTYHYLTSWPNMSCGDFNTYHKSRNTLTHVHSFDGGFHEYAIERSKDHISYAIDGRVVQHLPAKQLNIELSHSPFFLIMNTAIGGAWPGEPSSETAMPCEHAIDYVRVSRRTDEAAPLSLLSYPVGKAADELDDVAHSASWADAWHRQSSSFLEEGAISHGPPPPISML